MHVQGATVLLYVFSSRKTSLALQRESAMNVGVNNRLIFTALPDFGLVTMAESQELLALENEPHLKWRECPVCADLSERP